MGAAKWPGRKRTPRVLFGTGAGVGGDPNQTAVDWEGHGSDLTGSCPTFQPNFLPSLLRQLYTVAIANPCCDPTRCQALGYLHV